MKQPSKSLTEPRPLTSEFDIPVSLIDEVTKLKIQKHLTDITDVITDEDIRRIDTSLTLRDKKSRGFSSGTIVH